MNWHRLFGIMLCDVFADSPFKVELEKDLSHKQQMLDVVVIRKTIGEYSERLPDGLNDLADHNLISFKSFQQAFDDWTVDELIGHYVNYRKQIQTSKEPLLPQEHFRLFGVCARHPTQLAGQIELTEISPGVLECRWGVRTIRLIVLRDLPNEKHNAPLHLFSADREKVQYGRDHFLQRSPSTSTLIRDLLGGYQQEGINMPYTLEDYERESKEAILKEATTKDILKYKSVEALLSEVPIDKRLEGLSAEDLEAYLQKLRSQPPTTKG